MTVFHRREVLIRYLQHLVEHGYYPERKPDDYAFPIILGDPVALKHAGWMCQQAIAFLDHNDVEKADRWLGHIQGLLWFGLQFTIEQMRAHSRPPERNQAESNQSWSDPG